MQISYYTLLLGTIYCFQLSNFTPLRCEAFIGQEFFSVRRELGMSTRLAFRDTATNHRLPAVPHMTTPRLDRHLYHYTVVYLFDIGFLRIISLALRLEGNVSGCVAVHAIPGVQATLCYMPRISVIIYCGC